LLVSLGNDNENLCCTCDEVKDLNINLKPISLLSPINLFQKELPTSYNFDFGFSKNSDEVDERYIENYYDDQDEDDEECDPSHKRYASFSSNEWKVDHKFVVTTQEYSASRSNSYLSGDCLVNDRDDFHSDEYDDKVSIFDAPTVDDDSFGPKLKIWGTLPFGTLNDSSPDVLSASARQSQRVSKDQVKLVRILGSKTSSSI